MGLERVGETLEERSELDGPVRGLQKLAERLLPGGTFRAILGGRPWLGHPLHPVLTDLPIGFWTSSWVLDLVGGEQAEPAADLLVAAGLVSALPTAAAGLSDWAELERGPQRVGVAHAAANSAALVLYGASLVARRRDARRLGVALGWIAAGAATIGGHLGGHLTYSRGANVKSPD